MRHGLSAVEQHGPHLPLDVDILCSTEVALGAARQVSSKALVLPAVNYGYTGHVMDFPGTINNDFEHFMHHMLDITKSLAYHGFKKIILLNGHGSNMPNLDLVARRTNLETDAECVLAAWWQLLTVRHHDDNMGLKAVETSKSLRRPGLRGRLIAVRTRAACVQIKVEMSAMRFIRLRTKHRLKLPAGALMQALEELRGGETFCALGCAFRFGPVWTALRNRYIAGIQTRLCDLLAQAA